jgi:hypothetical protein
MKRIQSLANLMLVLSALLFGGAALAEDDHGGEPVDSGNGDEHAGDSADTEDSDEHAGEEAETDEHAGDSAN